MPTHDASNGNGTLTALRTIGMLIAMLVVAGSAAWAVAMHVGNADTHHPNPAGQLGALTQRIAALERQSDRMEAKLDTILLNSGKDD